MILGATQPPIEMSTGNITGGKGRAALKDDNLTSVSRLSRKRGNLDVSQASGPLRPVTVIALPLPFTKKALFVCQPAFIFTPLGPGKRPGDGLGN
jgi:hypothetical protein